MLTLLVLPALHAFFSGARPARVEPRLAAPGDAAGDLDQAAE
jgi:hypothetical protein